MAGSLLRSERPGELSTDRRTSDGSLLKHRRRVIRLSLVSATCMAVVAAYQIGLLTHVP